MDRLLFSGTRARALPALFAVATSLLLVAAPSWAGYYGNYSSPTGTVSFLDVEDQNGLYGAPTASANSLDFTPNAFEADCQLDPSCPPSPTNTSDLLTLQILADAGFFIDDVLLTEAGDTFITDNLLPFASATTTVTADVFVDILEIDGASVSGINGNSAMVFTSGGVFDTSTDPNGSQQWTGELLLDLDALIAGAGETGRATRVEISLSNTLTAYADNGGLARIEKKDIDGLAITVIPEPGTALLMSLGLAGLAAVRRPPAHARRLVGRVER